MAWLQTILGLLLLINLAKVNEVNCLAFLIPWWHPSIEEMMKRNIAAPLRHPPINNYVVEVYPAPHYAALHGNFNEKDSIMFKPELFDFPAQHPELKQFFVNKQEPAGARQLVHEQHPNVEEMYSGGHVLPIGHPTVHTMLKPYLYLPDVHPNLDNLLRNPLKNPLPEWHVPLSRLIRYPETSPPSISLPPTATPTTSPFRAPTTQPSTSFPTQSPATPRPTTVNQTRSPTMSLPSMSPVSSAPTTTSPSMSPTNVPSRVPSTSFPTGSPIMAIDVTFYHPNIDTAFANKKPMPLSHPSIMAMIARTLPPRHPNVDHVLHNPDKYELPSFHQPLSESQLRQPKPTFSINVSAFHPGSTKKFLENEAVPLNHPNIHDLFVIALGALPVRHPNIDQVLRNPWRFTLPTWHPRLEDFMNFLPKPSLVVKTKINLPGWHPDIADNFDNGVVLPDNHPSVNEFLQQSLPPQHPNVDLVLRSPTLYTLPSWHPSLNSFVTRYTSFWSPGIVLTLIVLVLYFVAVVVRQTNQCLRYHRHAKPHNRKKGRRGRPLQVVVNPLFNFEIEHSEATKLSATKKEFASNDLYTINDNQQEYNTTTITTTTTTNNSTNTPPTTTTTIINNNNNTTNSVHKNDIDNYHPQPQPRRRRRPRRERDTTMEMSLTSGMFWESSGMESKLLSRNRAVHRAERAKTTRGRSLENPIYEFEKVTVSNNNDDNDDDDDTATTNVAKTTSYWVNSKTTTKTVAPTSRTTSSNNHNNHNNNNSNNSNHTTNTNANTNINSVMLNMGHHRHRGPGVLLCWHKTMVTRIRWTSWTVGNAVLVAWYVALNAVALFILDDYAVDVGFGSLAAANTMLLIVPATRNNILTWPLGLSFENVVLYHRFLGRFTIVLTALHFAFFFERFTTRITEFVYWTGFVAFVFGVVIFLTTLNWVRRHLFNVFYWAHYSFVGFFVLVYLHAQSSRPFLLTGIVVYALDKCLRGVWTYLPVRAVGFRNVGESTAQVIFPKNALTRLAGRHKVGQYMFINFPELSLTEWHPFSISSGPLEEFVEMHIRALGNHTRKIVAFSKQCARESRLPWVRRDGPYGKQTFDYKRFDVVVLSAGGVGITPIMSILKDIYMSNDSLYNNDDCGYGNDDDDDNNNDNDTNDNDNNDNNDNDGGGYDANDDTSPTHAMECVYLIWVVPFLHDADIFMSVLRDLMTIAAVRDDLPELCVHIHCTQETITPTSPTTLITPTTPTIPTTPVSLAAPDLHCGRPNFSIYLEEILTRHDNEPTLVFACGPGAMVNQLWDESCKRNKSKKRLIHFYHETFEL